MRTLARGDRSRVEDRRTEAIRAAPEWEDLWREHDVSPAPAIDFSQEMVVAVFLGSRPTAGHQIEIVRARLDDRDGVVVEYVERRPPPDSLVAQVITFPFHIVAIERYDGPIRFARVEDGGV